MVDGIALAKYNTCNTNAVSEKHCDFHCLNAPRQTAGRDDAKRIMLKQAK